jgi:hypothetical protein
MVEAIDIKKALANQLTEAISKLKDLAIDGRAILTAIDMNGVIKDAIADDNKKSPFLIMATLNFSDNPLERVRGSLAVTED